MRPRTLVRMAAVAAFGFALAAPLTVSPAAARGFCGPRPSALVVDTVTGKVLYAQDPNGPRYPASLTKMMTLYILFEELKAGKVHLQSEFTASAHAAAQSPTKIGLRAGQKIHVEELILAMVTKSANDAAVTVGENIGGSEQAFAKRMTRTAHALGMTRTEFRNASGLPNPGQHTTAHDMAVLGAALQTRFPQYFSFFKTRSFSWEGHIIPSHIPWVGKIDGVDGIKTGYIGAAGFNVVSSVHLNGHRMIAVVMGGTSPLQRNQRVASLIESYLPKTVAERGGAPLAPVHIAAAPQPASDASDDDDDDDDDDNAPAEAAAPARPEHVSHLPEKPQPAPPEHVAAPPVEARAAEPVIKPAEKAARPVEVAAATPTAEITQSTGLAAGMAPEQTNGPGTDDAAGLPPGWQVGKPGMKPPRQATEALTPPAKPETGPKETKPAASARPPAREQKVVEQGDTENDGSAWQIQIGVAKSKASAMAMLNKARSMSGRAFSHADPLAEKVSADLYRARFSGFETEAEALKACAAARRKGMSCFPVRTSG